jgi:phage gpG-like protein
LIRSKVEFRPHPEVIARDFGEIAKGFRTFRVPLTASVRQVMIPSITQNFEVGGRPPWERLSDETIRRREREGTIGGFSNDILVESGRLLSAMDAFARWTIPRETAFISNLPKRAWYGKLHQWGNERYNVKFPARPFVMAQDEDIAAIHSIFHAWMNGVVVSNWRIRIRGL